MSSKQSRHASPRHPALTIALHWGSAFAVVVAVSALFLRDVIEDDDYRLMLLHIHRQLGLLVLAVALWRIGRRCIARLADHAGDMAALLRWGARAAHIALYGLLIALPLVGWALTSAHGVSLNLLGVVQLPMLTAVDSEFADTLSDYHILLAWGLLALVGAHAAAALWHHYWRKDPVLSAMLPAGPASGSNQTGGNPQGAVEALSIHDDDDEPLREA